MVSKRLRRLRETAFAIAIGNEGFFLSYKIALQLFKSDSVAQHPSRYMRVEKLKALANDRLIIEASIFTESIYQPSMRSSATTNVLPSAIHTVIRKRVF